MSSYCFHAFTPEAYVRLEGTRHYIFSATALMLVGTRHAARLEKLSLIISRMTGLCSQHRVSQRVYSNNIPLQLQTVRLSNSIFLLMNEIDRDTFPCTQELLLQSASNKQTWQLCICFGGWSTAITVTFFPVYETVNTPWTGILQQMPPWTTRHQMR